MVLSAIHACSGYGGMEIGLKLAGIATRTACHIEWETHAASILVARMEESLLDKAPIWSDVKTFPSELFAGKVDIVTAGFPCQPFSQAGLQKGTDDERWLWPDIFRIITKVGSPYVFLENVPGLIKHGLGQVLSDLTEAGYDAEWCSYTAAEVGAPHKRERVWILAYPNRNGLDGIGRLETFELYSDGCSSKTLADSKSIGDGEGNRSAKGSEGRKSEPEVRSGTVADSESEGLSGNGCSSGGGEPSLTGSTIYGRHAFPPARNDEKGWKDWIAKNGPEPSIRRVANGRPEGLVDALHLLGNGLVPQVAASAFLELAGRAKLV